MSGPLDLILWLDLETLGLDPLTTDVVEAAFVLTNGKYERLAGFETMVCPPSPIDWSSVDQVVVDMHTASGLRRDLDFAYRPDADLRPDLASVDLEAAAMLAEFDAVPAGVAYAGSGVAAFDKQIVANRMPLLNPFLSYFADPDVGVLRRTFRRWNVATGWDPGPIVHRAMPDVERSIAEAIYYRDTFVELNSVAYR